MFSLLFYKSTFNIRDNSSLSVLLPIYYSFLYYSTYSNFPIASYNLISDLLQVAFIIFILVYFTCFIPQMKKYTFIMILTSYFYSLKIIIPIQLYLLPLIHCHHLTQFFFALMIRPHYNYALQRVNIVVRLPR